MRTRSSHPRLIIALAVLAILAVGCGGSTTPDPQVIAGAVAVTVTTMPPAAPVEVVVTRIVEVTREVIVTATLTETPTSTVTPTVTPIPTAAATPFIGSLDNLIVQLQAAGLEALDPRDMTKDDYGLGPYVATGVHFLIPSLCVECGGRAFVGDPDDIEALRHYYTSMGESSALLFSWVFVSPDGRALLQLNGDLSEEQAGQYQTVIEQP